jgi:hypothetical protein
MMKFCRPFLIILLFPFLSVAQSNYKAGYIVTLKGDTLHGFIDYQTWDSNPVVISFKSAISDPKPQKLTISNINYFSVDKLDSYQKFTCSITMDETDPSRLGAGRDTSYRIDTIFLKILQKGKNVALYSYTDGLKTRFYISEAAHYTPHELVYRTYYDNSAVTDTHGGTVSENTYLKQLFALANKYNALDDKLTSAFQTSGYTKSDLLSIVSRINNISKAEYEKKYSEHGKTNFYIGAGLNISNTSSSSDSPFTQGGGKPYTSFLPVISLGINLVPNPNSGKVEFRAELSVAGVQFNSLYKLTVSPYMPVKASFNQLNISIAPQAIYNFYNAENFKFYGGFGYVFTYFKISNRYFGSQGSTNTMPDFQTTDPYFFNTTDNAFLLKAGLQFEKRFEIYFNYLTTTNTSHDGYFALVNNNEQIGFIYHFGK